MQKRPVRIAVLGSTGSIGRQTLDIVRAHPHRFEVVGLAAGQNLDLLTEQVAEHRPGMVSCASVDGLYERLRDRDLARPDGVCMEEMASDAGVDLVVAAVVGRAGLSPTLAALEAGKTVALANKEAMVMAGPLVSAAAAKSGAQLRPVDSEHSAIWQCIAGEDARHIRRLIITASGGALRDMSAEELAKVSPSEALAHPNWSMGRKITIDSATLFNKGLEVIEARWLFGVPFERIEVVMHRESIVHSLVEMVDGSIKAQLSFPDMRLPIQYALLYPERQPLEIPAVDLPRLGALHFSEPDIGRYPCLGLALEAGAREGTYPAALAAADESAVEAFLAGRLGFLDIPHLLADTLDRHESKSEPGLEEVLAADEWGRRFAREWEESRR